ncbi:MAG: TonB-dependent receptor [Myxococcales bacterium]|nr:TonB-dependent receptor [Myxococcales bacterium]MCB9626636.1 TonB-dependent receptor [Sandaracinaceae bacterium]
MRVASERERASERASWAVAMAAVLCSAMSGGLVWPSGAQAQPAPLDLPRQPEPALPGPSEAGPGPSPEVAAVEEAPREQAPAHPTESSPGAEGASLGASAPNVPGAAPVLDPEPHTPAAAQSPEVATEDQLERLAELSLEELLGIEVVSAARRPQQLIDAPAPLMVISAQDILERGYTNLAEIIMDLPGFDISVTNGSHYMNAYQRGYRTPYTQRTLILINGIVDNHLWRHTAQISRQIPIRNIERIEVLYGPASVVYGPNAFLGVINIITRNAAQLQDGETRAHAEVMGGTWETWGIEVGVNSRMQDLSISASARVFRSDEPDLSQRWPWLSNERLSDPNHWGPLLGQVPRGDGTLDPQFANDGVGLGQYHDPTDDYGLLVQVGFRGLTLGLIHWRIREGYGAQYTADHVQPNQFWNKDSTQVYLQHEAELFSGFRSRSLLLYRQSDNWGDWAEAEPDTTPGFEADSYVSLSQWNTDNASILFRQMFEYHLMDDDLVLSAGFKFERKDLTRAYDVSGYWAGSFSSSVPSDNLGPEGLGAGVVHSSSTLPYVQLPPPASHVPESNRIQTLDLGGFIEANLRTGPLRLVAGLRYDNNSLYGGSVNPRLAAIYRVLQDRGAVKLLFGTAFQEPAPQLLFGGWNGRRANPDLRPETVRNVDLLFMMQIGRLFLDVGGYYAHYSDVIKEEALNAGNRVVVGGELKVRLTLPNPIPRSADLRLWANANTTFAWSSQYYDFDQERWRNVRHGRVQLGDISPFRLNLGITVPILEHGFFTLRGNYVSGKLLYLRNPLRDASRPEGRRDVEPYVTIDMFLRAQIRNFSLGFLVRNLFDARYFHSGIEQADSGDTSSSDPSVRAQGYRNSLVPQPGRSVMLTFAVDI